MTKTSHTTCDGKPAIWLVYKVEFSSMENDLDRAVCRELVGWAYQEQEAQRYIATQPQGTYTGWDRMLSCRKDVRYPYYEVKRVEGIPTPVDAPKQEEPSDK